MTEITENVETLGDYICPICHNRFGDYGKCAHIATEMLDWQAAEIERLGAVLELVMDFCLDGEYAEAEKILSKWRGTK